MSIPTPVLLVLQQGIDLVLTLDPDTVEALDALDGRQLRVECTEPALEVTIAIDHRQVELLSNSLREPDAVISGSLTDLMSLRNNRDALYSGRVNISGDLTLAQTLSDIVSGLHIDWEEWLSGRVGDGAAHRAGEGVAAAQAWFARVRESARQDTADFLHEEADLVVSVEEVTRFSEDVDVVRADVDRLEARLALLESHGQRTDRG